MPDQAADEKFSLQLQFRPYCFKMQDYFSHPISSPKNFSNAFICIIYVIVFCLVLSPSSAYNRGRKFYRDFSLASMCILQTVSIIVIKELKEKRGIIMYQTLWNSINKQVKTHMLPQLFWLFHLWAGQRSVFWQDFDLHDRRYVLRYKDNRCPLQWRIYRTDSWFLWRYLYLYRSEPCHLAAATSSQVSTTSKISLNAKTAAR